MSTSFPLISLTLITKKWASVTPWEKNQCTIDFQESVSNPGKSLGTLAVSFVGLFHGRIYQETNSHGRRCKNQISGISLMNLVWKNSGNTIFQYIPPFSDWCVVHHENPASPSVVKEMLHSGLKFLWRVVCMRSWSCKSAICRSEHSRRGFHLIYHRVGTQASIYCLA